MHGHHVAPATHPGFHLNEASYRTFASTLWLLGTATLFVLGVAISPASLPGSIMLVALSMATGVCAIHAMRGGKFHQTHHRHLA